MFTQKLFATPACAVTFQWEASPDVNVTGYALYYGVSGTSVTNRLDVGQTTATTVKNLAVSSTYYFYVVAYDANKQESDPSNSLLYTATAMSPLQLSQQSDGTMSLAFYVAPQAACHIEYTDDLGSPSWKVLTTTTADTNGLVAITDPLIPMVGQNRFYRAVVP